MSAIMQKPIEIRKIEEYQPGKYYIRHLDSPFKDARLSMKTPFECRYLMAALISRGAHVKDQLLLEEAHRERFIELVDALHDEDRVHKRKKPVCSGIFSFLNFQKSYICFLVACRSTRAPATRMRREYRIVAVAGAFRNVH